MGRQTQMHFNLALRIRLFNLKWHTSTLAPHCGRVAKYLHTRFDFAFSLSPQHNSPARSVCIFAAKAGGCTSTTPKNPKLSIDRLTLSGYLLRKCFTTTTVRFEYGIIANI